VVERSHSIEEVSDHRCASLNSLRSLLVRGLGVPDGEYDITRRYLRDSRGDAAYFWGCRNHLDRGGARLGCCAGGFGPSSKIVSAIAVFEIHKTSRSLLKEFDIVDAVLRRAEERSLTMSP
jgi:hypothetical protein